MSNYQHLSPEERAVIMLERQRGMSLRHIAKQLGRSPSTLDREIRRNQRGTRTYCATAAGKAYRQRRRHSCRPRKISTNPLLCAVVG